MMTRDEFIALVSNRDELRDMMSFDQMEEMKPFHTAGFYSFTSDPPARGREYYAAVSAIPPECFDHFMILGGIRFYAIAATRAWPEEASMILSLPLDAARVLLDAGNHCALMIYPYMRLIHDDPR